MTHKSLRLMKYSGDKIRKVESNPADLAQLQEPGENAVAVTVKVAEADYVPEFVHVRAHIAPDIFTATVTERDLDRLEADPLVISLGRPKRLHVQIV